MKRILPLLLALVMLTSCVPPPDALVTPVTDTAPPAVETPTNTPPADEPFPEEAGNILCEIDVFPLGITGSYVNTSGGTVYNNYIPSGEEPNIIWPIAVAVQPSFSLEPAEFTYTFHDREGAPIDQPETEGTYLFTVAAEFERPDWSGRLEWSCGFTLVSPKIVMSTWAAAPGDMLSICLTDAAPSAGYRVSLPHLGADVTVDMACVWDETITVGDYLAVVPINVTATAGDYVAEIQSDYGSTDGVFATIDTVSYTITKGEFSRQDLQTSAETQSIYTSTNLSSDNEKTRAARANTSPTAYFDGAFIYPLPEQAKVTTEFGEERYVNDSFQSRHSGIDLAAAAGTEIFAIARGRVTLAEELVVNGNTVIIDHGMGIFSAYSHMSQIDVEVGDMVEQGVTIGLVGSTGYSTGPHLHFTVTASGYYVNPMFPIESDPLLVYKQWKGLVQ